jgi:hypothetical protein
MSRQAEKKKKVDNDKLNCMLLDVFTFLCQCRQIRCKTITNGTLFTGGMQQIFTLFVEHTTEQNFLSVLYGM